MTWSCKRDNILLWQDSSSLPSSNLEDTRTSKAENEIKRDTDSSKRKKTLRETGVPCPCFILNEKEEFKVWLYWELVS